MADARLKLSQEQFLVVDRLQKPAAPERRADPALFPEFYEIIPLSQAVKFYDAIAKLYNGRNTGKYRATYVEIDAAIRSFRSSVEGISVCDLGGGTGFLLHRFQHLKVQWTNVDISLGALAVFQSDFPDFSRRSHRNLDVCTDAFMVEGEKFDVFVMSYLLSSLDVDRLPDLAQVRKAMHDQSLLVVADNHFAYVRENPHYAYDVEGHNLPLAICPRPMVPEDIRALVQRAGFVQLSYKSVTIDENSNSPYFQVHIFKKAEPLYRDFEAVARL